MLSTLILSYFDEHGLVAHAGPDGAVGAHSTDPHYAVEPGNKGAEITRDTVLLIDLWARVRDVQDAPYANSIINQAAQTGRTLTGHEVDRAARTTIERRGMVDHLVHRTGTAWGSTMCRAREPISMMSSSLMIARCWSEVDLPSSRGSTCRAASACG
jgi:hypothetical protein